MDKPEAQFPCAPGSGGSIHQQSKAQCGGFSPNTATATSAKHLGTVLLSEDPEEY